jgi:hypothetical protein
MNPRAVHPVWLAALCAAFLTWAHAAAGSQAPAESAEQALRAFHNGVDRYAALHRRLEGPLPPRIPARETFSALIERQYLAAAIRRARLSSRPGDIIDPAAAHVFRTIIATAFAAPGGAALAEEFRRRAARPVPGPVVNEPYPMEAASVIPDPILQQLPALAEDVEYRAVNADLVLWDIHAGIVVDVLPDAFLPES